MTYTLYIGLDGEDIYEDEISADLALRLIASIAKNRAALDEPIPEVEVEETPRVAKFHQAAKPGKKNYGQRHCSACGKTGHTARTCDGGEREESAPAPRTEVLTETEYNFVQECKADGMSGPEVSRSLVLPAREVNAAWAPITYEGYLDSRKGLNKI